MGVLFRQCSSLAAIEIPDGVTSIESSTFESCTSLTSVTIPDSVVYIDGGSFYDCASLAIAYVTEVSFDLYSWKGTAYLYSEEKPTCEGNYWHYVNGVPTIW